MEWTVVTVLAALVGLLGAASRPLSKLTEAITELREAARYLREAFDEQKTRNEREHGELAARVQAQDGRLEEHERRIFCLENKS